MNYQKIMDSEGVYSIEEHLLSMKAGFKKTGLTDSLVENLKELKKERKEVEQIFIDLLIRNTDVKKTLLDKETIDFLFHIYYKKTSITSEETLETDLFGKEWRIRVESFRIGNNFRVVLKLNGDIIKNNKFVLNLETPILINYLKTMHITPLYEEGIKIVKGYKIIYYIIKNFFKNIKK